MRGCFSHIFLWLGALSSYASQDPWKGDEYAKNSESQKSSAEEFIATLNLHNASSILDVGCGDGKITAAIARALPKAVVIGVDISSSMIEVAANAFTNQGNLSFSVHDAAELPFREQFDLITSFTVMQWVLPQVQALKGFEKALKPGGSVWIQMPTELPVAMQRALEEQLTEARWKDYYANFAAPWRFYQPSEYRALLTEAHLSPMRLDVTTKHEKFPSRAAFQGFLRQWFPYLRALPENLKDVFLTELLDRYLKILPVDEKGQVSFIVDRLEVEAQK